MIKNVKSVVIPNSGGMVGIETSVVMGIVAGNAKKDLMVISNINKEDMVKVRKFIKEKNNEIILDRPCNDIDFNSPSKDRELLSIEVIYNLAKVIKFNKIEALFTKVITLNL